MFANPRTAGAAGIGGLLLGIFAFLGPEPISWPRAAVLIAACLAIAAVGIFSHGPPDKVDPPEPDTTAARTVAENARTIAARSLSVTVTNAKDISPEPDVPPTVGP